MALQKGNFPILLRGLGTGEPPLSAPAGRLALLENCYAVRGEADGSTELRKRIGWSALSMTTQNAGAQGSIDTIASAKRVGVRGSGLILETNDGFYARADADGRWYMRGGSKVDRATADRMTYESKLLNLKPVDVKHVDCLYYSGKLFVVWQDNASGTNAIRFSSYDFATGAAIVEDVMVKSGATLPRVSLIKNSAGTTINVAILYKVTADNHVKMTRLDPGDHLLNGSEQDLLNIGTEGRFEIAYKPADGRVLLITFGGSSVSARYLDTTGVVSGTATTIRPTNSGAKCVGFLEHDLSDGFWYLGYSGDGLDQTVTGLYVLRFAVSDLSGATDVDTVETAGMTCNGITGYVDVAGGVRWVYYDRIDESLTTPTSKRIMRYPSATDPQTSGRILARSVALASKMWRVGTNHYMLAAFGGSPQETYVVLESRPAVGHAGRFVGTIMPGNAGGHTLDVARLATVVSPDASTFAIAVRKKTRLVSDGGVTYTTKGAALITASTARALSPILEVPGGSLLTGGLPRMYDGNSMTELGFIVGPEAPTATQAAGSITVGTRRYKIVYEWTDADGRRHQSPASPALVNVITSTSKNVTLTIETLRLTAKTNIGIAVYRTEDTGTVYYKVSPTSIIANDPTVNTVTFLDNVTDANLILNETLYTTGGILENVCPPTSRLACNWGDHIVLAGCETPDELWISKPIASTDAPGFAPELSLRITDEHGGITAVAPLDTDLIVFKRTAVYVLAGPGPNAIAQGMPDPQRIAEHYGTIEPESVVATPAGVFFKASKGFCRVSRGRAVEYIGADVSGYDSEDVTGAVVLRDLPHVVFTTASGTALVYDWIHNLWGTYTNHAAVSACVSSGLLTWVTSSGVVRRHVAAQYADASAAIVSKIRTAWLTPFGLGGRGRFYAMQIFGELVGAHTLSVTFKHDFEASSATAKTLAVSAAPYWFEARPARQKGAALEVTIEDVFPVSASAGFRITGLALSVGAKSGQTRRPAAAILT